MDGAVWWAAVHGVAKSRTRLSNFTLTFHFHTLEKVMATHSSVFSWRTPGMGEPGGLPSLGSHRVRPDWSNLAAAITQSLSVVSNPDLCLSFLLDIFNLSLRIISFLHPALSLEKLSWMGSINGSPCPLVSVWLQPKGGSTRGRWGNAKMVGSAHSLPDSMVGWGLPLTATASVLSPFSNNYSQ